jgi:hypothetical protein
MLVILEDGCIYSQLVDDKVIPLSQYLLLHARVCCRTFICGNHPAICLCISTQVSFDSHTNDHLRAFLM